MAGKEEKPNAILQAGQLLGLTFSENLKALATSGAEYGSWGRHAIVDIRYKDELKKAEAYTFAGGYDAARRYPKLGEGLKLLAKGYQRMSGVKRVLNPWEEKSIAEIFKKELSDEAGNIAGIEQAQKDIAAGIPYETQTAIDSLDKRVLKLSRDRIQSD